MRLFPFLTLLTILTSGFMLGPIRSRTLIAPGQQFVLGGQQQGAFSVRLRNSGPVPFSVAERRVDGMIRECGQLAPRQAATLSFRSGSAALVRNSSSVQAEFDANITGHYTKRLNMGYEVLKPE